MRVADTLLSAVACVVLAGCDGVFGLQHLHPPADAHADAYDNGCPAPTGSQVSKLFGGRPGGVLGNGVAETFVSSDLAHVAHNFGALDRVFVCLRCKCTTNCESISATNDDDVVTLVRFDLGTEIPTCSKVQSATLYLHTTGDQLGGGSSVVVQRVLEPWDEGIGGVPIGVDGVANWTQRKPNTTWKAAGVGVPGSREAAMIGELTPTAEETDYATLLDAVAIQRWADDAATNHGIALTITGSTSDVHFYSSEAGSPEKRPMLQVVYQQP